MRTIRTGVLAFLLFSILILGCKKSEEVEQTTEPSENQVQTVSDTAEVEQEIIEAPSLEKLEKGKAEVETRLEALLSLIEQKEKALIEREQRLMEQEAQLEAEAQDLATRQSKFWRQQVISWIVLVLGVGGIVLGFIIGRKKQKPPLAKPGPEEVKAKSTEEQKEKEVRKDKDQDKEKETPKTQSEQKPEPNKKK
jgi:hypothetical protein